MTGGPGMGRPIGPREVVWFTGRLATVHLSDSVAVQGEEMTDGSVYLDGRVYRGRRCSHEDRTR